MSKFKVAVTVAQFNNSITELLLEGALETLHASLLADCINVVWVPGAVEIPFAAQQLARTGRYAGIVALGAVIYGETDHYHYVCDQVNQGCQRVMLDESIPIGFGVLTTKTVAHAKARAGGDKGNAGSEAATAVLKMIHLKSAIASDSLL